MPVDDTTTTSGMGGMGDTGAAAGGWAEWLQKNYGWLAALGQAGLGAYQASQKPSYHQTPLSPEQSALYQRYIQAFDNPATKYNAGVVSDIGKSELGRLAPTLPWNRTSITPMAYQGLTAPTLSPSGMPGGTDASYYNNLIRQSIANQQGWEKGLGANSAPPPIPGGGLTSEGSGPTGVPGDPFGHITSPAGSANDPFAGMPWGQSGANGAFGSDVGGAGGAGGIGGIGGWLAQHPEVTKLGVNGIAAAIGTAFGIVPGLAIKLAASYLMGKTQKQTLPPPKTSVPLDLTPAGVTHPPPRSPYDPGFASGAAGQFNQGQENRLANNPGQFAPERLGGGQGFGYGLDYDQINSGGKFKP